MRVCVCVFELTTERNEKYVRVVVSKKKKKRKRERKERKKRKRKGETRILYFSIPLFSFFFCCSSFLLLCLFDYLPSFFIPNLLC